jgi:hypothetical protein
LKAEAIGSRGTPEREEQRSLISLHFAAFAFFCGNEFLTLKFGFRRET